MITTKPFFCAAAFSFSRNSACRLAIGISLALALGGNAIAEGPPLKVATFRIDATPPIGAPLCDALVRPAEKIDDPLSARGVVLLTQDKPIVLCAIDWVGIGNTGHDAFREALAEAAGTTPDRVAVHSLHQHDAPGCDFAAEELLAPRGLGGKLFHVAHARATIRSAADAVREAIRKPRSVTHVGVGKGRVERVASNRRVMGPDGKVKYVRYSASKIPEAIAAPEGTVDPDVRLISLWDGDKPLVSLTYYATHPQSHYGKGAVSADFPGAARAEREKARPDVFHAHFNGAGGNVTAGKYNNGDPANRPVLAARLAAGMKAAWENTKRSPLAARDVAWRVRPVVLPPSAILDEKKLLATLDDTTQKDELRLRTARDLVFLRRCQAKQAIPLTCLKLGDARVLHLPGELFVEYQLAAQAIRPDDFVATAAYGDYGPGYIGTKIAYTQGGYETSYVSRVAPEVEDVLMPAIRELVTQP
jgi:hypothetical protein